MKQDNNWVRIEREFDGPIDLVWKMWTDPALFKQWYGPNGMSVPTAEMDVTVGGTRTVCMSMQSPERSMEMWFTGVYKEVNAPRRLVYTESMCDADGTLISPKSMGMPDSFPDITEVIVELTEDGDKTRMVMVHVGVEAGTAGAGGWNQAFDKLGALAQSLAGVAE
ncbi:SRPBCC domain-containing protein [uncultured Tateyamaria sp.]|uniref:SRPBCC family protein n=1 Tax=uncultured Tateyamaria sp. TaxID=455651 RepID=UPI002626E0FC|nr:SRPBCC domain-containing protein [uncultured Tateyamaria sp.]